MQFFQNIGQNALHYQGRSYPLNKPQMIIGSDPQCDVRIENNPHVYPMHAQIISQGGQVFLQYMERGAAIWVNGSPASQQMLQDGDEIVLGDHHTRLTLQLSVNTNNTEQISTLVRRPQQAAEPQIPPETGRHSALFIDPSRPSGLVSQPLTRQAPFSQPEPVPSMVTKHQKEQPAFQAQEPLLPGASGHAHSMPAGQVYAAPANASAFGAPGNMPSIASTPPLGAASTFGVPPSASHIGASVSIHQNQAPMPALKSTVTDTTRYLCAAGHLDEDFQDYVMRHVIHEERRALGESYGVDMAAVVSWCKSGLRRVNTRDAFLGVIFLVICSIVAFHLFQEIGSVMQQIGLMNQYAAYSGTPSFQYILLLLLGAGPGQTLLLSIILLVALGIESWIKRHWPKSHPGFVSLLVLMILLCYDIPFGLSLLLTLALWTVIFVELIVRYYGAPTNHLRRGAFNPRIRPVELGPALEKKLNENFTTSQRNVIAYSGYRPFAGAGYYEGGWSFAVDTSKGMTDSSKANARLTPLPFTVSSLYAMVEKDVQALGINDVLEVEGKLFVNGRFLPENPPFFNAAALCPVTSVDPRLVEQYKEKPTEDVRYYQCLRFNFWRGEMIFTAFLRFIQRGKDLFTEVDYLLLPPMKDDYYWVDRKEITPTAGMIWQLFKRSFDGPLKLWFGVPLRLLRGTIYTAEQQKLARVVLNNPAFDYGAATSLRWEASDTSYHLFFQKLDEEMYLKIVEMQILETIITFLEAHQIDTTELRERQQTILNNNTYVNGQTVNIGAMATGTGGHAVNNPAQSMRGSNATQTSGKPQSAVRA